MDGQEALQNLPVTCRSSRVDGTLALERELDKAKKSTTMIYLRINQCANNRFVSSYNS